MKVAHVFISMPVGGAEDLAGGLARNLPPGIELEFVCLRSLGVVGEELRARGIPVHLLPFAPTKRLNLLGIWRLARWLKQNQFSAVHTQVYNSHVYGILAAWLAGIPAVMHQQKTYQRDRLHRWLMMKLLTRLARLHLTLSSQTKADIIREFHALAERVEVLPNAVDLTVFRPAEERTHLREQLGFADTDFLIGGVGSLTAPKNHPATLAMASELAAESISFRVVICGEGELRENLTQQIHALHLTEKVTLAGNQRPVARWIQMLDLFVLPSSWEGQPLVLIQAMACGIPIVASRIEGNVAVLGAEHPGLFDLNTPGDYAAKVKAACQDEKFRQHIVAHQKTNWSEEYSMATCARKLAALYEGLAGRRSSGKD